MLLTSPRGTGLVRDQVAEDPYLGAKRNQLVVEAATQLANARMITFDRLSGSFTILYLGRIAAKYYIRHASIEIFNKELKPEMTEADVLKMLCMSTEVVSRSHRPSTPYSSSTYSSTRYKSVKMRSRSLSNSWKQYLAESRYALVVLFAISNS